MIILLQFEDLSTLFLKAFKFLNVFGAKSPYIAEPTSYSVIASLETKQVITITIGFVLITLGTLILIEYAAQRQRRKPIRRISQFVLLGMIASFAGAVGNFIQSVASSSLGAIIGTLAGGALVGFFGVVVDTILEAFTSMPSTRQVRIGRIAFISGIVIEILQGSILLFALKLP